MGSNKIKMQLNSASLIDCACQRVRAAVAPGANSAGIDVDESRARVVADSSAMQVDSGVTQGQGIDPGNANIDGVRLHVQAVSRYAGGAGAKEFIAPRGTVATNDIDFGVGAAERSGEISENVEDVRIVVFNVAGAVVAQEMVELVFGLRQEGVSAPIDDIKTLAGVRVVEAKMVLLHGGGGA